MLRIKGTKGMWEEEKTQFASKLYRRRYDLRQHYWQCQRRVNFT